LMEENKKARKVAFTGFGLNIIFVGAARFELATSWSQTRRDDRATLRPDTL
jgi:hypothetical protein